MDNHTVQQELFKVLKTKIPEHLSAADEIARILDISSDSAYRRMRGEKPVTIDELEILCNHYKISVDELMHIQTDAFVFHGRIVNSKTFSFSEHLKAILQNMMYMNSFADKQFYYLCKDIPLFHHFQFREIAAFKYYFWMRTILHMPEFSNRKVSFKEYPDEIFALGRKSLDCYNALDSYELWNIESLNSTIRQIDFYRDSGLFESPEDTWALYDAMEKLVIQIEAQAGLGYKFSREDKEMKPLGKFHFYFNEVLLLDNSMLAVLNNTKIAYTVHSGINFMVTRDARYCDHMYEYIQNLMRKSTLISNVNEKERLRFVNRLREKIKVRKESI